jgi:phosphatidylserine/phosphatidylglycerophosphate/cardiolipin synthase-like enzyme
MEILYTSGDVHKAIKKIFSSPCKRRVAVVAYLGVNAENYLPNPKNLEIVCCPEPGATSPRAVRALIDRGAIIQFSEGLHSKVYWSNKGCVITSANISHRALGNAPQKEAGIFLDSSALDIDRLISESKPFKITQALMDKLEILDRKIKRVNELKTQNSTKTQFDDWYNSPYREPWKINWYDSEIALAKNAKIKA